MIDKLELRQGHQIFGPAERAMVDGIVDSTPDLEFTFDKLFDLIV